jgi:hypothetical protein
LIGLHFGDQEYAVTLAGNHMAYQLLRESVSIISRRVDQTHAERNTGAQRFFFESCRMSLLSEMPGALTDRRDNDAVLKSHSAWWRVGRKN